MQCEIKVKMSYGEEKRREREREKQRSALQLVLPFKVMQTTATENTNLAIERNLPPAAKSPNHQRYLMQPV